jgi:hypothetical protein
MLHSLLMCDFNQGVTQMKLNDIQIEVLDENLSKAYHLAELMYQASIEPTKQQIPIQDWEGQLKRLSIRLDDMRGVMQSSKF